MMLFLSASRPYATPNFLSTGNWWSLKSAIHWPAQGWPPTDHLLLKTPWGGDNCNPCICWLKFVDSGKASTSNFKISKDVSLITLLHYDVTACLHYIATTLQVWNLKLDEVITVSTDSFNIFLYTCISGNTLFNSVALWGCGSKI